MPRIVAAALAALTATLALSWFIVAATAAPAHADALCDAMRARFGPGYPCISLPTNTFTPTAPAGPTTTAPGGSSSGGPQVGIDTGPGPGIGNGTPIVPVPGTPTNTAPGSNPAPAATPTTSRIPGDPTPPGQQTGQPAPATQRPPATTPNRPTPSSTTPAPAGTSAPTQKASIPTTGDTGRDETTQMLWLLGGAAAIVAGATTARSGGSGRYRAAATANGYPTVVSALRSWLPGGGSERARIGNSQYVLINDPTSPKSYVFHEDVPPGGHIGVNPDGTATVYNKDGQPVGTIAKPWAYDSLGRPQKTWYTIDNNGDLVQHVEAAPNALYPILADPTEPPDLPIGMMSGSNATLSDVTGSGTATAPPPPVEQSSIANSPGIQQLPTLSEPADPPAAPLPPVEQTSLGDSPAIKALPELSDPAPLPQVDPATSDSPAIQQLPTLSQPAPAPPKAAADPSQTPLPAWADPQSPTPSQPDLPIGLLSGTDQHLSDIPKAPAPYAGIQPLLDFEHRELGGQRDPTPNEVLRDRALALPPGATQQPLTRNGGQRQINPDGTYRDIIPDNDGGYTVYRNGQPTTHYYQYGAYETIGTDPDSGYRTRIITNPTTGEQTIIGTTPDGDGYTTTTNPTANTRSEIHTPEGYIFAEQKPDGSTTITYPDGGWTTTDAAGNQTLYDQYGTPLVHTALHSAPKLLTSSAYGQAMKATESLARSQALTAFLAGDHGAESALLKLGADAARLGRFAPAVSAPVGIYMDINRGMSPGKAITAGTVAAAVGVGVGFAAAAASAPAIATVAAVGVTGIVAYQATKYIYQNALPQSWQHSIDGGLSSIGRGISSLWN